MEYMRVFLTYIIIDENGMILCTIFFICKHKTSINDMERKFCIATRIHYHQIMLYIKPFIIFEIFHQTFELINELFCNLIHISDSSPLFMFLQFLIRAFDIKIREAGFVASYNFINMQVIL